VIADVPNIRRSARSYDMRGGIISLRGLPRYAWLRTSSEVNFRRPARKPSV